MAELIAMHLVYKHRLMSGQAQKVTDRRTRNIRGLKSENIIYRQYQITSHNVFIYE